MNLYIYILKSCIIYIYIYRSFFFYFIFLLQLTQMKTENYIAMVTDKPRPLPINPPRSNKKKKSSATAHLPCYSLFDTVSAPLNWLDKRPPRKHSVSVDGSDTLEYENKYAGFWRRASLPNKQDFLNASSCALCNLLIYSTNNNMCHHSICQHCITLSSCPLCPKVKYHQKKKD